MELSNVDREDVNAALSERIQGAGHLTPTQALLCYIARQLDGQRYHLKQIQSALTDAETRNDVITYLDRILRSLGLPGGPQDPGLRADVREIRDQLAEHELTDSGEAPKATFRELLIDRLSDVNIHLYRLLNRQPPSGRDRLLQGILDEAVEAGLLDTDTLPEEWRSEVEEPEPPEGDTGRIREDEQEPKCHVLHPDQPVYCQKAPDHRGRHGARIRIDGREDIIWWLG